jgi:hypothetical protein
MRLPVWVAAGMLICAASARAQAPPAAAPYRPVARSALLTVDGALEPHTLLLRVRRAQDQQPLTAAELSVTVDGRGAAAGLRPDGAWAVALPDLGPAAPGKLEIVVAHDGLREVLDGQIPRAGPPPAAGGTAATGGAGAGVLRTLFHKQAAWWVLNIVVVLIGVVAVSRRMS